MDFVRLFKSFRYAWNGFRYATIKEQNIKLHIFCAIVILLLAWILHVGRFEFLILFSSITLVLFAELINTAIEAVVDLATKEYVELAKIAKDVAAAAVLLTSIAATIVGALIFYPYIKSWII